MEDKENVRPESKNIAPRNSDRWDTRKSRGFSNLLDSACKETRNDEDAKYSLQVQCKDVSELVNKLYRDYEQEEAGRKLVFMNICCLTQHRS